VTARVALVAHRIASPSATGIGRYYVEVARALAVAARPGRRYVVVTPRERERPTWLPPGLERAEIPGPRKALALAWALAGRPPVDRTLGAVDLVHALHPWTATPSKAPLVTTICDLMPIQHRAWYPRHESWGFARGVAHARAHARRVITISEHRAAQLVDEAGIERDRIRVVHLAAGDEFRARAGAAAAATVCARYGVEPGRFVVHVGQVARRKNLAVILRAIAAVPPDALGAPALLLAGPRGVGADEVDALVDELGIRSRVRFGGYVADDDLPTLVGASLALLHPSYDEGFGLTPIEAMAAGVPALASDRGALPEVVGGGGVLLDADDPDAWAAAIVAVATDPEHRAALVARGDAHQARYTWERVAAETAAVHDEVLA
jgi:alpha-1,3-rhamnosyl/mannosyltransferase